MTVAPLGVEAPRSRPLHSRRILVASHLALLGWLLVSCNGPTPERKPDVLLYTVDTLRADSLSPYGHNGVKTSAIQRLADDGIVFERAYALSSWTRPSIASLLTGLPPDVHAVNTRRDIVPASLSLLSERFRAAGYRTAAIVTNPNAGSFFGFDQGYETFLELYLYSGEGRVREDQWRARSEAVTSRATEWIDADLERPFFLYILTTDPHAPYDPPPEFDLFQMKHAAGKKAGKKAGPRQRQHARWKEDYGKYLGEIAANDHAIGSLIDHLRKKARYQDSLIVLTSDHGEAFGEHGVGGHGNDLFEEVLRVPLIVKRPREPEAASRVSERVSLVDVHPTILDAAGLAFPDELARSLFSDARTHGTIYGHLDLEGRTGEMLIDGQWKLVAPEPTDSGKALRMKGGLFDLSRDPRERIDLSTTEVPRRKAMLRALHARRAGTQQQKAEIARPETIDSEIPADVQSALEALGYVDSEP